MVKISDSAVGCQFSNVVQALVCDILLRLVKYTVLTPDLAELLVLEHNMEPVFIGPMETTQKTRYLTSNAHTQGFQ